MSQRKHDELEALSAIFSKELRKNEDGGIMQINVETPAVFELVGMAGTSDKLTSLPPLIFHFDLPRGYPETSPPNFLLRGSWLSQGKLSSLCRHLDALYQPDQEVLYTWFRFLQTETWSFLQLQGTLSIVALQNPLMGATRESHLNNEQPPPFPRLDGASDTTDEASTELKSKQMHTEMAELGSGDCKGPGTKEDSDEKLDNRAVVEIVQSLRDSLIAHENETYNKGCHTCEVCMCEWPGSETIKLVPCSHVVCYECALSWFRGASLKGKTVTCPSFDCSTPFPHNKLKQQLTEDELNNYERRLLEYVLLSRDDVVRCPRSACQTFVTLDRANRNLAICTYCRYAFCIDCGKGYHGVEPCRVCPQEQNKLYQRYTEGTSSQREELERQYGKRRLERLVANERTNKWLETNSQPCPHCNSRIQKNEGCNMMVCWKCKTHFCWLCCTQLNSLNPYNHFLSHDSPCYRRLHAVEAETQL